MMATKLLARGLPRRSTLPKISKTVGRAPLYSCLPNCSQNRHEGSSVLCSLIPLPSFHHHQVVQERYFSYAPRHRRKEDDGRLNMESSLPLESRVRTFLSVPVGKLHPRDFKMKSRDLIQECGERKSPRAMKLAHEILDRLTKETRQSSINRTVPASVYECLLFSWVQLCGKEPIAPKRMGQVLDQMIAQARAYEASSSQEHDSNSGEQFSCLPTANTFNTYLLGLAKAANKDKTLAFDAESTLKEMDGLHLQYGWSTKPNAKTYTHIINAHGNTRRFESGDRARWILGLLLDRHEQEKQEYEAQVGRPYSLNPYENEREILVPDKYVYTATIRALNFSDAWGSADKAMELLEMMMDKTNEFVECDATAFATVMHTYAKKAGRKTKPEAREECAKKAEDILGYMLDYFKDHHERDMQKSCLAGFNICMNAWAEAALAESASRAEMLFNQILEYEIPPDEMSFNTCMKAWARISDRDDNAPIKAEELLNLMLEMYQQGAMRHKPGIQSYSIVMDAYSKSKLPNKTTETRRLLEDVLAMCQVGEADYLNAIPFTSVILAAANTPSCAIAEKTPSTEDMYNASATSDDDAYSIAQKTYHELRDNLFGVKMDHIVFSTMLQAINQHTDMESSERKQMVELVFDDACQAGAVSGQVVRRLREASPSTEFLGQLLQDPKLAESMESVDELPESWTSNVPRRHRSTNLNRRRREAR